MTQQTSRVLTFTTVQRHSFIGYTNPIDPALRFVLVELLRIILIWHFKGVQIITGQCVGG